MVEFKKNPSTDYHRCLDIFNKYFYVSQDEFGTENIYKPHKNKLIEFILALFERTYLGWFNYCSYGNTIDIWGKRECFLDVATELENNGFKVTIYS